MTWQIRPRFVVFVVPSVSLCDPSDHFFQNVVNPVSDFGDLDAAQQNAVRSAISQRVSLIQGPPGIGTFHMLPSLVSCDSYHLFDFFAGKTHTAVFLSKLFV